jgi:NADP-dependent 3-hydroxy acid dehydrogenase YdfG
MNKTILITGASSGIGKAAAVYFSEMGWQVAATMRKPENEKQLTSYPNVKLFPLDVLDEAGINKTIQEVISVFGKIDVIVNNAGYGAVGIFEAATQEQIRRQFDTNVFGLMNVTRAILPHFRARKEGTIINVASVGGRSTFPLYSLYHGTKWAVEGFSESLHYELKQFNIKIRIIEPGPIKTDFYERSMDLFKKEGLTAYDAYQKVAFENMQKLGTTAVGPKVVAKVIYKAATDKGYKMRYPVGGNAPALLFLRRIFPDSWMFALTRMVVEKK